MLSIPSSKCREPDYENASQPWVRLRVFLNEDNPVREPLACLRVTNACSIFSMAKIIFAYQVFYMPKHLRQASKIDDMAATFAARS